MLEVKNLSKQFDGNYVLKNINLKIEFGEVYGIIGANGSGKSTFMNILNGKASIAKTGGYEGQIFIDGKEVWIGNHNQSVSLGIAMVHQELALFSGMSVAENIKINRENTKGITLGIPELVSVDKRKNEEEAKAILQTIGASIKPEKIIDGLTLNEKQFVELARELDNQNIKLLILDEPTSSLNITEAKHLLKCVREIARKGIAVIFISHRLEEIMEVCDKVAVLRDGELVSTYDKQEFCVERFADDMVGCEIVKAQKDIRNEAKVDKTVLMQYQSTRNAEGGLDIFEGEVVGITGLAGQGQEQFSEGLFGLKKTDFKTTYRGQELKNGDTGTLIHNNIYYLSEDRASASLFLNSPIWKNIVFGTENRHPEFLSLRKFPAISFLNKKVIARHTEEIIEKLNIVCSGIEQNVRELSGGNQQKVCVGRAITFCPEVLFVGEPTRGIDIYSKELILDRLIKLNQEENTTIVVTSGEIEELIRICDRIVVMYQGSVFKVFEGAMNQEEITLSLYGEESR